MMLALYLEAQYQSRFAPLSPGSGHAFMALCSSSEAADDPDSGLDENTTEAVVIKHIDRNILACQICQHRYREPKILPCLHSFCLNCLSAYLPPESLAITCPLCGQQSILPQRGVKALQPNFFLSHLIEVVLQEDIPSLSSDFSSESYSSSSEYYEQTRTFSCYTHQGQSWRFFCSDCETGICAACTQQEHRQHHTLRMTEAVEKEKRQLRELIEKAQEKIPELNSAIANVSAVSSALQAKRESREREIGEAFDQLVELVEKRRKQMLTQLGEAHAAKQSRLGSQRDDLESGLADLLTSCEFVEKALSHGSETEILLVKKQVGERLAQYGQMDVVTQPAENQYLVFTPGSLEGFCSSWGQLCSSSALPHQSEAVGGGLKQCVVSRNSFITVAARDWQAHVVPGPEVDQFLCEIVPLTLTHPSSGPIELTTELTDMCDGTYELTYSVPVEGQFELSVKLFGDHIKGSPFKIMAVPPPVDENASCLLRKFSNSASAASTSVRQRRSKSHVLQRPPSIHDSQCSRNNPIEDDLLVRIGARGRGRGEFTNPQGVTVTQNGRVLVSDSNNQCVQVFGPHGEVRLRFGVRGRCPGQMQRPTGVCVMPNGNVAVADYDNKWVSVYDQTGKYISRIGNGKLLGPKGVCVNNAGHLVVVDNKASCVLIFQLNGKLLLRFGTRGGQQDQLAGPHYVAVNSMGQIIVSDFHNHSIKVFSSDGEFLFCFGSNGEGNGQFNAPTGLAVDKQDNILVADWGNSRIQVFDSSGSFLAFVNTLACPLYGPQGLAVTPDGNIVVADSGNHCYKLYRYLQ